MGKLDGKVAFITGAARGQGRAHAIRMAQDGADIIGIDICQQMRVGRLPDVDAHDLDETVRQVGGARTAHRRPRGRRPRRRRRCRRRSTTASPSSVRSTIVVANAGIGPGGFASAEQQWEEVVGVNLTGVWNTGRVAIPSMIEHGQGGSIILTSSTGGLTGSPSNVAGMLGYTAAKHGVIGLMRSWANFLAPHFIRVNSVAPTTVRTPMANDGDVSMILQHVPELANSLTNAIPVEAVDAMDVANAVAWLASDEARYITGTVSRSTPATSTAAERGDWIAAMRISFNDGWTVKPKINRFLELPAAAPPRNRRA